MASGIAFSPRQSLCCCLNKMLGNGVFPQRFVSKEERSWVTSPLLQAVCWSQNPVLSAMGNISYPLSLHLYSSIVHGHSLAVLQGCISPALCLRVIWLHRLLHADSSCGGAPAGHLQHISNTEAVYCIPSSNCEVHCSLKWLIYSFIYFFMCLLKATAIHLSCF